MSAPMVAYPRIVSRRGTSPGGVSGTVAYLDDGITIPPWPPAEPEDDDKQLLRRERLALARAGFVLLDAMLLELPVNCPISSKDREVMFALVKRTRRHFQKLHPAGGLRAWWDSQDTGPLLNFLAASTWPAVALWGFVAALHYWGHGL